jgi:hypothetical protein
MHSLHAGDDEENTNENAAVRYVNDVIINRDDNARRVNSIRRCTETNVSDYRFST